MFVDQRVLRSRHREIFSIWRIQIVWRQELRSMGTYFRWYRPYGSAHHVGLPLRTDLQDVTDWMGLAKLGLGLASGIRCNQRVLLPQTPSDTCKYHSKSLTSSSLY